MLPYAFSFIRCLLLFFFFFNDTATTEIYTLSLHDALPICLAQRAAYGLGLSGAAMLGPQRQQGLEDADRKSTRLNSSHLVISYAVFCLKKKKKQKRHRASTNTCTAASDHDALQPRSPAASP